MSNNRLNFTLLARVQGLHRSHIGAEAIQYKLRSKNALNIKITTVKNPHSKFYEEFDVELKKSLVPDIEVYSFVKNLNKKKYIPFGENKKELPLLSGAKTEIISSTGIVADNSRVPFSYYPPEVQVLARTMKTRLEEDLQRFFGLLRWRQNPHPAEYIIDTTSLGWGCGRKQYLVSSPERSVSVPGMRGVSWDILDQSDMKSLWSHEELHEPLGHELLREATYIAQSSVRSSILVACAALETGVKRHCAVIAPDTTWILEKAPSPPLFKILRDFIPKLHSERGTDISFWTSFKPSIKKINSFIEIRNKLSHTGVMPEKLDDFWEYITAISDILYILDVLEGHEWAKEFISGKIKVKHGWPASKKPNMTITQHLNSF